MAVSVLIIFSDVGVRFLKGQKFGVGDINEKYNVRTLVLSFFF